MNQPWVYMSSQSWTPLPPPIPYHLSGSFSCTSPKHPVSCIKHRLVIRFLPDIIHVSVPFSQIIPPSPSPSESPLQYSCLEYPMDGGAWWAAVHGVAKSLTWLRDFPFTFHFHALEKEMATHSSVLAWRIPGTEEPGGLPSMGSHRVGHDWSGLAAAAVENHCSLQGHIPYRYFNMY